MIEQFSSYEAPFPAGVKLPKIQIEQRYYQQLGIPDNISNFEFLRRICFEGVKKRGILEFPNKEKYFERLKMELSIFEELGFIDYVLLNWDIINFCHETSIPTGAGRGCFVAGSKVKKANGLIENIEDIKIGDIVIDHENNPQEVLATLQYDISEEIIELTFDGGITIKCTKDHEFFTENRGWVKAIDLNENDNIREI